MKKSYFIFIKVFVSLGLLSFLFYRFPISLETWQAEWKSLKWEWFVFTLLAAVVANLIGFWRWYFLLKIQGVPLAFSQVTAIGWISLFFSNFSIGILGGDVARVFYLLRLYPAQKSKAIFSVLLDRVIGFLGLCAVAFFVLPLSWKWLGTRAEIQTLMGWLLAVLFFGLLGLVSLLFFRKKNFGLFSLVNRTAWGRKLLEPIDQVVEVCLQQKKIVLGVCLGLSVGVHFSLILCGYGLARVFSLPIPFYLMACLLPLVNVAITLPITISGLGVREALVLFLFQASHLDERKALLFSLSYWLVGLIIAAGGGIFYIFYRCSEPLKGNKITLS